jgi:hypothetical protein
MKYLLIILLFFSLDVHSKDKSKLPVKILQGLSITGVGYGFYIMDQGFQKNNKNLVRKGQIISACSFSLCLSIDISKKHKNKKS